MKWDEFKRRGPEMERAYREHLKNEERRQDEYYDRLGDIIEEHPLVSPRTVLLGRKYAGSNNTST